jgi:hypothetical protein
MRERNDGDSSHFGGRALPADRGPCGQCDVLGGFGMPCDIAMFRLIVSPGYILHSFEARFVNL